MVVLSCLLDFGFVQGDVAAMDLMDWWPRSGNDSFAMVFSSRSFCCFFFFFFSFLMDIILSGVCSFVYVVGWSEEALGPLFLYVLCMTRHL